MSWIKMRTSLMDDPRVMIVAHKCNALTVTVVGALHALWSLADRFANEDGVLAGYTPLVINNRVGVPNFCESLPSDWIDLSHEWVKLPEYQAHNGTTAKTRAESTKRVALSRSRNKRDKCNATTVTETVTPTVTPSYSYSNSSSRSDLKEKEKAEVPLPSPGSFLAPIVEGCTWFRATPDELTLAREHYQLQGFPLEWFTRAIIEVDCWLGGNTDAGMSARSAPSHVHKLHTSWVLKRARDGADLKSKPGKPVAIADQNFQKLLEMQRAAEAAK